MDGVRRVRSGEDGGGECRRWRRGVNGVVVEMLVVEMFVVVVVDPK